MKEDKDIESFFEGMKKADISLPVPPFVKPSAREEIRSLHWVSYAAATLAAIVVMGVFLVRSPQGDKMEKEIPFLNTDPSVTGSLLNSSEMAMPDWQSPTDGLLEDF